MSGGIAISQAVSDKRKRLAHPEGQGKIMTPRRVKRFHKEKDHQINFSCAGNYGLKS